MSAVAAEATTIPDVRMIYLVPSDQTFHPEFADAISGAIKELQAWYGEQLGDKTFTLHSPVVESFPTTHPASFYSSQPASTVAFFFDVFFDGFDAAGGFDPALFRDPNHVDVFYIDANPAPGQIGGAGLLGAAVLPRNDLLGLIGHPPPEDPAPVSRWIGGLGHELGHGFGLPHPPGCEAGLPTCVPDALMWLGFRNWPDTFLLPADKATLEASPFFTPITAVPFPSTLVLVVGGLLFLGRRRRTR